MTEYSNESIQFDCFRGCTVVTDEESGEKDIRYRQGCCKLEVYNTLKGISQEQWGTTSRSVSRIPARAFM